VLRSTGEDESREIRYILERDPNVLRELRKKREAEAKERARENP
jgi:hypothetical protein